MNSTTANSPSKIKSAAAAEASAKAAELEQAAARAAEALSNAVSVVLKRSGNPIRADSYGQHTQPIEPPPAITQEAVIFETSNTSPSPSTEDDTTFDGEIITDSLPEIDDEMTLKMKFHKTKIFLSKIFLISKPTCCALTHGLGSVMRRTIN
ncbi:MAG: hypothetical protein R3E63_06940 [Pseudomonadales bacterium]